MRYLRYKSMCINAKYVRVSGTGAITLLQIALDMVNTCQSEGTLTSILDNGFFKSNSKGKFTVMFATLERMHCFVHLFQFAFGLEQLHCFVHLFQFGFGLEQVHFFLHLFQSRICV